MEYALLDDATKRQILEGHLRQHEADHFQAMLNIAKERRAKNKEGVKTWTDQAAMAEANGELVARELKKLPKPPAPEAALDPAAEPAPNRATRRAATKRR